jgi:hypothetical protein
MDEISEKEIEWVRTLATDALKRHSGDPRAALQIFVDTMNEVREVGHSVWWVIGKELGSFEGTIEASALAYLERIAVPYCTPAPSSDGSNFLTN